MSKRDNELKNLEDQAALELQPEWIQKLRSADQIEVPYDPENPTDADLNYYDN